MTEAFVVPVNIHVFYDGSARDLNGNDIDVGDLSSDEQVKSAVETAMELDNDELRNFTVDRHESDEALNITIRPTEVFG